MRALQSTTSVSTWAAGATANRTCVRSPLATNDARQKGGAVSRRLSRLHGVGVRVHVNLEGKAAGFSRLVTLPTILLVNWRGSLPIRVLFQPHSHRLVVSSHNSRLVADRALCRAAIAITNSSNTKACRPRVRKSLAHEQVVQAVAHVPHFHNRVLSSAVSVGIDPNEIGLTHGQTDFAFGATSSD